MLKIVKIEYPIWKKDFRNTFQEYNIHLVIHAHFYHTSLVLHPSINNEENALNVKKCKNYFICGSDLFRINKYKEWVQAFVKDSYFPEHSISGAAEKSS